MEKHSMWKRMAGLCVVVAMIVALAGIKLMQIQIVDGETYRRQAEKTTTSTVSIKAARGEILDTKGRPIVKNRVGFNIVFDRVFMPRGEENATIEKLISILSKNNEDWEDPLPISRTEPYTFDSHEERDVEKLKQNLGLQEYATAQNCMDALDERYDTAGYEESLKRKIVGVRYNMTQSGFSKATRYDFAKDVSTQTIIQVKELSFLFEGVDITEDTVREYVDNTLLSQTIGYVGAISQSKYEQLKDQGYTRNDEIGREGVEAALESVLRGEDGLRQVVQNNRDEIISSTITSPTTPGNSVMLTIDIDFQKQVETILAQHIAWLRAGGNPKIDPTQVKGGSIVVLDVNTGGVLALANYPNYDMTLRRTDYSQLLQDPLTPMYNRATLGLYRPGSTFKTVVAIAGLSEGLINANTTIRCNRVYDYYGKQDAPSCLGNHGDINVKNALEVSCNVFFYDLGRRLGIEKINQYARMLGYEQEIGLEVPTETGHLASKEYREAQGGEWYNGDVLQAAIGQSDVAATPMQLATAAMTIANKGVRYQTHLVKAIVDYNNETVLSQPPVQVLSELNVSEAVFDVVKEGMVLAANRLSGANSLSNLGYRVALKTGTPQISTTKFNSAAIAFAPADAPEIAIGIMLEQGENASYMVRDILDAYAASKQPQTTQPQPQEVQSAS